MDYFLLLMLFLFVPLGIIIMKKFKFYQYDTNDMSYPLTFKVFLGGLLLFLFGIYGIVHLILKVL